MEDGGIFGSHATAIHNASQSSATQSI